VACEALLQIDLKTPWLHLPKAWEWSPHQVTDRNPLENKECESSSLQRALFPMLEVPKLKVILAAAAVEVISTRFDQLDSEAVSSEPPDRLSLSLSLVLAKESPRLGDEVAFVEPSTRSEGTSSTSSEAMFLGYGSTSSLMGHAVCLMRTT
jgi:hypothetical protein